MLGLKPASLFFVQGCVLVVWLIFLAFMQATWTFLEFYFDLQCFGAHSWRDWVSSKAVRNPEPKVVDMVLQPGKPKHMVPAPAWHPAKVSLLHHHMAEVTQRVTWLCQFRFLLLLRLLIPVWRLLSHKLINSSLPSQSPASKNQYHEFYREIYNFLSWKN